MQKKYKATLAHLHLLLLQQNNATSRRALAIFSEERIDTRVFNRENIIIPGRGNVIFSGKD